MYFRSNGEFNLIFDKSVIKLPEGDSSAARFHKEKACEINNNEEESVIDILRQILIYKPEKRPSTQELLVNP